MKERKLYLWDWSMVDEAGPRFEDLVASHVEIHGVRILPFTALCRELPIP